MSVAQIAALNSFSPGNTILSADINSNFTSIRNAFNALVTATDTLAGNLQFGTNAGIGGAATADAGFLINAITGGGVTQQGVQSQPTFAATTTSQGTALYGQVRTVASVFTMVQARGLFIDDAVVGAGSVVTNQFGVYVAAQTGGGTNYAIFTNAGLVTFGDLVTTVASSTSRAGLRLPHGSAPTSPVNGDMWTTTAGVFVRINGVTIGPLS